MPYSTKNVSVATTATELVPYNPRRTSVAFFNYQTVRASIVITADQLEAEGFPINSNGGSLTFNKLNGSDPTSRYIAKAASGSVQIQVIEEWQK